MMVSVKSSVEGRPNIIPSFIPQFTPFTTAPSVHTPLHVQQLVVWLAHPGQGGFVSGSEDIILHGNNGTFLSPNYPSNYDNNLDLLYIAHLDTPGPQQVLCRYIPQL